jgi:hypothetical protein
MKFLIALIVLGAIFGFALGVDYAIKGEAFLATARFVVAACNGAVAWFLWDAGRDD